jgi:large subunit ribosomal protein L6
MSRIGKLPIIIPNGVNVEKQELLVKVSGSKGELELILSPKIGLEIEDSKIVFTKKIDDPQAAELFGLTRMLVSNMIKGVSEGFKKELEINGIGYRAAVSGGKLNLNLGYSHPIEYVAPSGIQISVEKNVIIVSGIDKQLVGQAAADIRSFRKPEPYKGKGIKYVAEHIRRKAGKTGTK